VREAKVGELLLDVTHLRLVLGQDDDALEVHLKVVGEGKEDTDL